MNSKNSRNIKQSMHGDFCYYSAMYTYLVPNIHTCNCIFIDSLMLLLRNNITVVVKLSVLRVVGRHIAKESKRSQIHLGSEHL